MARISDYSSLKDAVIQTAEDDGAEFATYLDTAIDLAQIRLSREIDTLGLMLTFTVSINTGDPYAAKPDGYRFGHDMFFTTSAGEIKVLKKKTHSYVIDYWPVPTSVGEPKYYSDYDSEFFYIVPTPSGAIDSMTLRYEGRPDPLTSAEPTNYFTNQCPDALFFGVMVEMCKFSRNDTQQALYEKEYANACEILRNEARRSRRDETGTPSNGSTNTVQKGSV